jgi:hypothetical protein
MHGQEFHLIRTRTGLSGSSNAIALVDNKIPFHSSHVASGARVFFAPTAFAFHSEY